MTTELVKAGADSPFAVLQMEPKELRELIAENLGTETLSARDLDRVKVPAGAGTVWEVPTLDGTDAIKCIEGVIVHRATRRAYWPDPYSGSNDAPECSSEDGIEGVGEPGGPCSECPYNEFGSADDGVSKACKETRQLFVLTPDSLLPFVVTVPPGSLANVKAYFMRLMRSRVKPTHVVTRIALEKAKNKTGIDFSKVVLTAGQRLDPEAAERLAAYASALEPAFRAAARVAREEVSDA